jgi:DNA (cytosine-5)-methyltransferase 1
LVRTQVEKDKWCVRTLEANASPLRSKRPAVIGGDIRWLSPLKVMSAGGLSPGEATLLVGGPPCQSFSYAGSRRGLKDARGLLIGEFVRMLEGIRPELFLFENVPGFVDVPFPGPDGPKPLGNWFLRKCVDAGYAVTWGVVDAADFGAPQHRERFVALGCRYGCSPSLPAPVHGPKGYRHYVTLAAALRGLDEGACGLGALDFSPRAKGILDHVPAGGNWQALPDGVKALAMGRALEDAGGKTGFWRRLSWDEPSPSIVSRPDHKGTCFCHPEQTRALTARECARIQGFPDWWRFEGSTRTRYRQVGDAVPVMLAEALGKTLMDHLTARRNDGARHPSFARMALRDGRQRRPIGLWGWSSPSSTVYFYELHLRRNRGAGS